METTSARIRIAVMLACLAGGVAHAEAVAVEPGAAARLVSVMRLDFTLLDAVQWHVRLDPAAGGRVSSDCLSRQDYARFNPALAERVAARLSTDEIEAALAFYASGPGRKFSDAALAQVHRQADASVAESPPDFTPDERTRILAFMQTTPYPKLQRLLAPPPAGVLEVQRAMLDECSRATTP